MDCKLVADQINNEDEDISECRIILSQIKTLLIMYPTYTIHFVKRETYEVAHTLAWNSTNFPQAYSIPVMPHCIHNNTKF